jgi:hypothetical protein
LSLTNLAELSGGGYVNEEYRKRLMRTLEDETYLEQNGKTIQNIVDTKVYEFEKVEKRKANVFSSLYTPYPIAVEYLLPNKSKAFTQNRIQITKQVKPFR